MGDISIKVVMQSSKSVRFSVRSDKAESVVADLKSNNGGWLQVETIRHGVVHLRCDLIAWFIVRPLGSNTKKTTEGVTLKEIAKVMGVNYFSLVRRVNKNVHDAIKLKLGGDRRVLLTDENREALAQNGLDAEGWEKLQIHR